ncbi:hypothetical protein D047_1456A, partial [Vibrio parahaemolyticus VPTS-2010_2]
MAHKIIYFTYVSCCIGHYH